MKIYRALQKEGSGKEEGMGQQPEREGGCEDGWEDLRRGVSDKGNSRC